MGAALAAHDFSSPEGTWATRGSESATPLKAKAKAGKHEPSPDQRHGRGLWDGLRLKRQIHLQDSGTSAALPVDQLEWEGA